MRIKNWEKFQHYKYRNPPWIKLHVNLLDDPEWFALSGDASKMLASLWLLASEHDGELPPLKTIAFRIRITEKRAKELISQLDHWLEQDASAVLAECEQHATTEYSLVKLETEVSTEARSRSRSSEEERFEAFWKAYPPRSPSSPKDLARKSWVRALHGYIDRQSKIKYPPADPDAIVRGARGFFDATSGQHKTEFIPMASTWLNQRRWDAHSDTKPSLSAEEQERLLAKYREKQGAAV